MNKAERMAWQDAQDKAAEVERRRLASKQADDSRCIAEYLKQFPKRPPPPLPDWQPFIDKLTELQEAEHAMY